MNLAALQAAVNRRTGHAIDATALTEYINEALQAIAADYDWPWLDSSETLTTVSGQAYVTPGGTWQRTKSLKIDGYTPLRRMSIEELDEIWTTTSTTGRPRDYAIEGERIELRPVPDGAYAIAHRFSKSETDLGVGASPLMPARFHTAIVHYASALVFGRMGDLARADREMGGYREWSRRMADDRRRHRGPLRIRTRTDRF